MFTLSTAIVIALLTHKASADCSYVMNWQYESGEASGSSNGSPDMINECSQSWAWDGTEDYKSQKLTCDADGTYIHFYADTSCNGSPAVIANVTAIPNGPSFESKCFMNSECTNYVQLTVSNTSMTHYDPEHPPQTCIDPEMNDFINQTKQLINVCAEDEAGGAYLQTCDDGNVWNQYYYPHSVSCDGERILVASLSNEGCVDYDGQIGPYGKVLYCGQGRWVHDDFESNDNYPEWMQIFLDTDNVYIYIAVIGFVVLCVCCVCGAYCCGRCHGKKTQHQHYHEMNHVDRV